MLCNGSRLVRYAASLFNLLRAWDQGRDQGTSRIEGEPQPETRLRAVVLGHHIAAVSMPQCYSIHITLQPQAR